MGLGMFGWGNPTNFVEELATPLHARAFYVESGGESAAIVVCELLAVSQAIKEYVSARVVADHPETGLRRENLMLLATHTHSAPGGYSQYTFYAMEAPGFCEEMLEDIVDAIAGALVEAWKTRASGFVRFDEGVFDDDCEVAFNRSPLSWNRNPETRELDWSSRHLGVDRRLRLLRFDDADGRCRGELNFFGVHGTSVHSDNRKVHYDNKGYAAAILEREQGEGFVAGFAQGTTGDVTPNFRTHPGKPWIRGKFPDDDASARFNGELQARKASETLEQASQEPPLAPVLGSAHLHADLSKVEVLPRFVNGQEGCRTGMPKLGVAMFFGTDEGPGLPRKHLWVQALARRLRPFWRLIPRGRAARARQGEHDATHAEKVTMMETGRRRFLGIQRLKRVPLPSNASPTTRMIHAFDAGNRPNPKPWTPIVLPAQLIRIGDLVIAAAPHELTTIAGRRIEEMLVEQLEPLGVQRVVVAGYANAYAGYVTTPEEYEVQDYEGASTHFGKWTLPAWLTLFSRLGDDLVAPGSRSVAEEPLPPVFQPDELAEIRYRPSR